MSAPGKSRDKKEARSSLPRLMPASRGHVICHMLAPPREGRARRGFGPCQFRPDGRTMTVTEPCSTVRKCQARDEESHPHSGPGRPLVVAHRPHVASRLPAPEFLDGCVPCLPRREMRMGPRSSIFRSSLPSPYDARRCLVLVLCLCVSSLPGNRLVGDIGQNRDLADAMP